MGYITELNTLLKLPQGFNIEQLTIRDKYTVFKETERIFPLHIAILLVTYDWNFLGYVVALSAETKEHKTKIEFELVSLFTAEEQKIYKDNFLKAAKVTGEITK